MRRGLLTLDGMKRMGLIGLMCLLGWAATAQEEEDILRAALYLSGASTVEEVPAEWVERLEALHGRCIRINDAHPRADGVLSAYQLAALADYRASAGDVLSWEELALVDGFGQEAVAALQPFLSLKSRRLPGHTDTVRTHASLMVRTTLSNVGAKARASGDRWRAGAAWRGSEGSLYAEYAWRGHRLLLGDYHLRFGQGLAAWTGFSMESLSTLDAFVKRAPGVTPSGSYNASLCRRGGAYEYAGSHVQVALFGAVDGSLGIHADYRWRYGQIGGTATSVLKAQANGSVLPGMTGNLCVALDGRYNRRGRDWVFETAYKNRSGAGKLAFRSALGESWKLALQARAIPSRFSGKKYGEYAFAAGSAWKSGRWVSFAGLSGFGSSVPSAEASLTVDAAMLPIPGESGNRLQIRAYASWNWQVSPAWALRVRLTERYRNYEQPRTDFRVDLRRAVGPWQTTLRSEGVHCAGWGLLSYLESGHKGEALSTWLRFTGFWVDQWADRIYCYERDAAGTFSVPAYSGRGASLSAVCGYKLRLGRTPRWRFTLRANLRAAWMVRVDRKPVPTLNFQFQCER